MATCKHLKWLIKEEGIGYCRCGETKQFRYVHSTQYNGSQAKGQQKQDQDAALARAIEETS